MSSASEGESPNGNHQEDEEEEEWEISIGTVKIVSTKHPFVYARSFPSVSLSGLSIFLSFYLSVFLLFLLFLLFLSFCPLRQNFCFSFLRFFPLLYLIVSKCSIRMLTIGIYVEIE